MRTFLAILLLVACALLASRASAHGMRSVYVEIVELSPGHARVSTRAQVPVTGVRVVADAPCAIGDAAPGTEAERADAPSGATGASIGADARVLTCSQGIGGARVSVLGLGPIVSEAVVWVQYADGASESHLLTQDAPTWTLPAAQQSAVAVARAYIGLGVRHILTGADHLLFLVGLVLVLRRLRAVLLAETAFTLSHSLSFTATALGWIRVSSAAAEACIALSLVLVALDAGRGAPAESKRQVRTGAALAFLFGLVHGLGFAGGLAEIGLPPRAIPAALLGFAGGVEIGQVAFLAVVVLLLALAARVRALRFLPTAGAYAVGVVGCFWLFERLEALLFRSV
jgi:hypothetical protein